MDAGSAARKRRRRAPDSRVVAAFQNVSAEELLKPDATLDEDVVICGDDADAKARIVELTRLIPNLRPVDGGALYNARYVEQITPLLVNINRIYRTHSGVRITGVRKTYHRLSKDQEELRCHEPHLICRMPTIWRP